VIRIQVANAFADQPIDGNYVVEPMGTVALGPGYGRVNIAGLSILEAEDAIKRHLATMIENPAVQATMYEKAVATTIVPNEATRARATDAVASTEQSAAFREAVMKELEALHRQIMKLQTENAEMKLQLERQKPQSGVVK
jgi:hypothetical protein